MKTPKPVPGGGPAGTVSPASAVSDSTGTVRTTLRITSRYAGDNYRVIASTDPAFPCATNSSCAKSGELVAWKRVYIETNRMYKKGGLLTDNVPKGSTRIPVQSLQGLPSPPFDIVLLHAWRFEEHQISFDEETVTVIDSTRATETDPAKLILCGDPSVADQPPVCNSRSPLSRDYFGVEEVQKTPYEDLADGFGVISGSDDLFDAGNSLAEDLFAPAFVEYVPLPGKIQGGSGVMPAIRHIANEEVSKRLLDVKWGRTNIPPVIIGGAVVLRAEARPNHQVQFIAGRLTESYWRSKQGSTWVAEGLNGAWIFRNALDPLGLKDDVRAAEAAAHELAHQWVVNANQPDEYGSGHCGIILVPPIARRMFDSSHYCTMTHGLYDNDQVTDGVVGFHYESNGVTEDSELIDIREKEEPVPQDYAGRTRPLPW
jgi:hypothetical protein